MRIVTTFVVSCLLIVGSASADAILSNLPGTGSGTGTNLGLASDLGDRTKGVGLTMGATAMDFQSMVALISNSAALAPASTLSGGIYADSASNPGALLAAFAPVPVAAGATVAQVSITTAAPFTLQPSTSYWFILDGPSTTNSLLWESLSPNTVPTASGVSLIGYRFSSNGGTTWGSSSIYNGMTINAVVPEPMSLGMLALVGALALRRR